MVSNVKFTAEMLNKVYLAAVLFMAVSILLPAAAAAECDPFPRFKIWGNLTHGKVQSYVDRKLDGDWQPYLSHLEKQLAGVKGIMARGKPARIRSKGKLVNLAGDDLVNYVRLSEARLDVARCLAEEAEIASLNDFSTAAGGGEPADTEIKMVAQSRVANALKLAVETACENGNSVFKITNRGANWPGSGTLSIYRMGEGRRDVINSRRLRLKTGQLATFRVKAKSNPTGRLGLFVKPSWYERPFDYDATMRCR